jgi:hypothetical protein
MQITGVSLAKCKNIPIQWYLRALGDDGGGGGCVRALSRTGNMPSPVRPVAPLRFVSHTQQLGTMRVSPGRNNANKLLKRVLLYWFCTIKRGGKSVRGTGTANRCYRVTNDTTTRRSTDNKQINTRKSGRETWSLPSLSESLGTATRGKSIRRDRIVRPAGPLGCVRLREYGEPAKEGGRGGERPIETSPCFKMHPHRANETNSPPPPAHRCPFRSAPACPIA